MLTKLGAVLIGAMLTTPSAHAAQVDRREVAQQERIDHGIRNGELNRREAGRLEAREGRLEREIGRDRAIHGGRLSGFERARIERQQNRLSRSIAFDRHNCR